MSFFRNRNTVASAEILGKFVKKKILDPCTMSSITKLKLTAENLKEVKDVNVNFSAKEALKNSSVSDVKLVEFKYHCQKMYKATAEKLIGRSPLKFSVVCDLAYVS